MRHRNGGSYRKFIVLAVAVVIVGIGFWMKIVIPRSSTVLDSITKAMATSKTLSPHEIHLNYRNMKDLPDADGVKGGEGSAINAQR
jgi:hypothetical protein